MLVELRCFAAYNPCRYIFVRNALKGGTWQERELTQESQVILYTHPDCAFSAAAKMDYRKRKVAYEEVDMSRQDDRLQELLGLTKGERITPVIVDNGTVTIGFKGGT